MCNAGKVKTERKREKRNDYANGAKMVESVSMVALA